MLYLDLKNKLYYIGITILCVIIFGHIYLIYAYPSLGPDSGYYLKTAYDLANGLSFYSELNCSYTPMSMYLLSIPFYLSDHISLGFIFTYFLLIYLFIGIVFYKIAFHFNSEKKTSLFFTLLLISGLFLLEGIHILLEPYVLFFQFLAIYAVLRSKLKSKSLLFAGVFVFLSFFSKQYGLFIIPAIMFFIYKESNSIKQFIKKGGYFFLGLLIPVGLITLYFSVYKGMYVQEFIYKLIGVPALKGDEIITNIGYSFTGLWHRTIEVIKIFPFIILFIAILLPVVRLKKISSNSIFTIILFLGSTTVLLFAYYPHYFQLVIPYSILCIISLLKDMHKKYNTLFGIVFLFFVGTSFFQLKRTYRYKKSIQEEQTITKEILSNYLNESDDVYLQGLSPAYYFLCKYDSPNFSTLGYKFPIELTLKTIDQNLSEGDYIIINESLILNEIFGTYSRIKKLAVPKKNIFILKKMNNERKR